MVNCDVIGEEIDDFLEGKLPRERAEAIKKHIAHCPSCRRNLQDRKDSKYHLRTVPSGDWLDVMGRKLSREGPWQEVLRPLFLPWEKKIPLLVAALTVAGLIAFSLFQVGCEFKPEEKDTSLSAFTPPPPSSPAPVGEAPAAKLRRSRMSSVLVLDEPEGAGEKPAGPAPQRPFQDQHVKLRVPEVPTGLRKSVELTLASGGQLINHPVKGFDNMGPHEKILVFPLANYRNFLRRLQALGTVEHPPLINSDFVTVRLTVLPQESSGSGSPPDIGE